MLRGKSGLLPTAAPRPAQSIAGKEVRRKRKPAPQMDMHPDRLCRKDLELPGQPSQPSTPKSRPSHTPCACTHTLPQNLGLPEGTAQFPSSPPTAKCNCNLTRGSHPAEGRGLSTQAQADLPLPGGGGQRPGLGRRQTSV